MIASTLLFIGAAKGIINYTGNTSPTSADTGTVDNIANENGMKFVSKVEGKKFYIYTIQ